MIRQKALPTLMMDQTVLLLCLILATGIVCGQLVINVKNQGGDVLQEVLTSNVTDDTVQLKFFTSDGSAVTQLLDFSREVQIFRIVILSEEEGVTPPPAFQVPYRTVCFVTKLSKQDFIAADAIAKLRQKNPHTVRYPEEDHGRENATFEYSLDLAKSHIISSHIAQLCQEASYIYSQENDLKVWAALGDATAVLDAFNHSGLSESGPYCSQSVPDVSDCLCRLNFCIPWYPCGLKFCRGHDQSGKALSYRCGIKTCKKCLHFRFSTHSRHHCPWDD